jgi:hypothetical protein
VVPTMKHGGGGVMVLCWWHCLWCIYNSILQPSHLVCASWDHHLLFNRTTRHLKAV